MADLSSILPTMPTYFGAQLPASPPASGTSPIMDALRTVSAVKPPVPQNPYSLVPAASGPPANPQSHFGAVLPARSPPAARIAAPAASGALAPAAGGFTPAPRPADMIASPTLGGEPAQSGGYTPPGVAAPNVIAGGLPQPAPLPPHPADYATWYAGKLAENMQAGAEAGPQGGQGIHFIGPNSPPMEAPAHPAAVNVIRGGIQSGGGGDAGGGGMNLMQFEAVKPLVEARMQAQQLNPAMTIPNELMAMAKYRRDQRIAGKEDPTKVMADYEGELYRIHNQTLALIQALSQH